ncbi:hypothetical protein S40293_08333 [Stachybotrys chartarum IBT 40293]|nr:hypothetical protein S40293_08333 [Stachybotrys chartarum IBT 40293]
MTRGRVGRAWGPSRLDTNSGEVGFLSGITLRARAAQRRRVIKKTIIDQLILQGNDGSIDYDESPTVSAELQNAMLDMLLHCGRIPDLNLHCAGPRPAAVAREEKLATQSLENLQVKATDKGPDTSRTLVYHTLWWAGDIVAMALQNLKQPLSWILWAWLSMGIATMLFQAATHSVRTALLLLCKVPGVSWLSPSLCQPSWAGAFPSCELPGVSWLFPSSCTPNAEVEQSTFKNSPFATFEEFQNEEEKLLPAIQKASAFFNLSLPHKFSRLNSPVRILQQHVRRSDLPSAQREHLVAEFGGYIDFLEDAVEPLVDFQTDCEITLGLVDAKNMHTLQRIEELHEGLFFWPVRFVSALLSLFSPRSASWIEQKILEEYTDNMSRVLSIVEDQEAAIESLMARFRQGHKHLQGISESSMALAPLASARNSFDQPMNPKQSLSRIWKAVVSMVHNGEDDPEELLLLRKVHSETLTALDLMSDAKVDVIVVKKSLERLQKLASSHRKGLTTASNARLRSHQRHVRAVGQELKKGHQCVTGGGCKSV